jgi:hypothetical protein
MPITATVAPLKDAVEQISQRQAVGTRLTSAEWDAVPAEIRLRTMWAARLEQEQMAASLQAKIAQFIALERTKLEGGGEGVFMDRGLFMEKMRAEFKKAGYRPDPKKKGTLQDFTSSGRLGLIWDMNLAQAQGYAHWKTSQSAVSLRMWPAMEFVRLENRVERRAWSAKWKALGGKFYPGPSEYPEGRMIALKNDPIWKEMNRFGVPWKPFDWGSGMGTRNIGRREALALGVVKESDAPQAPEKLPFNENAQASLKGISPARRRAIEDDFLGDVEIEGDIIRLLPPQGPSNFAAPRAGGSGDKWEHHDSKLDTTPRPPKTPDGSRLTDTIRVPDDANHAEMISLIRDALGTADRVHGDGVLPKVAILIRDAFTFLPREEKPEGLYGKVTHPAKTPTLSVSPKTVIPPGMVALHELGHLLDNMGLHQPTVGRPYASGGQPQMEAIIQVLRGTTAVGRLVNSYGYNTDALSREELFARAYAQFIIEEGDDAELKNNLREFRKGGFEKHGFPRDLHWGTSDFRQVRALMRALFKQAGWKGGPR